MEEEVKRNQWLHTSHILATTLNASVNKRSGDVFHPQDFNPFHQQELTQTEPAAKPVQHAALDALLNL